MDEYENIEKEVLPPEKKYGEVIDWFDESKSGLYKVENENSSNQGQIQNSYNVKTLTNIENEVKILDWLRATDEQNFCEMNSTLDTWEEIDSGIGLMSSEHETSVSGEEKIDLVVRDIGIQVCDIVSIEVDESLKLDKEVLENNEKLRAALKGEIERHKKVKMKYKAVEKELKIAEETVRDVTSIEIDLRKKLRSREEENDLLKEKLKDIRRLK